MQSKSISITGEKNTSFTVISKDEYEKLKKENGDMKKIIEDKYEELKLKKENEELNQLIEEKKKTNS